MCAGDCVCPRGWRTRSCHRRKLFIRRIFKRNLTTDRNCDRHANPRLTKTSGQLKRVRRWRKSDKSRTLHYALYLFVLPNYPTRHNANDLSAYVYFCRSWIAQCSRLSQQISRAGSIHRKFSAASSSSDVSCCRTSRWKMRVASLFINSLLFQN